MQDATKNIISLQKIVLNQKEKKKNKVNQTDKITTSFIKNTAETEFQMTKNTINLANHGKKLSFLKNFKPK